MIFNFTSKAGLLRWRGYAFFSWCRSWVLCKKPKTSKAAFSYVPPYSWLYFVGNKRSGGSENRAAASWAHEIMSALRRLFFFCRRPADCSVIKGLMFLDILKTIYK